MVTLFFSRQVPHPVQVSLLIGQFRRQSFFKVILLRPLAGRVRTGYISVARSRTQQLWFAEFVLMIFGELGDELGAGLYFFDLVDFVHFFGFHAFDNLQFAFLFDFGLILHPNFGQFRHIIMNAMIDLINGGDFLDLSGLSVFLQILNHGDCLLPGLSVSINFESFIKVLWG